MCFLYYIYMHVSVFCLFVVSTVGRRDCKQFDPFFASENPGGWVSSWKTWGPNPQEDVPWRLWLRLRWRHLGWTAANDPRWMVNLYDLNGEPKGTSVIAGSVALRIWDPKKWGNYRFHYEQDALFLFVIPLSPLGSDIICFIRGL
jgi:hypothetical protein